MKIIEKIRGINGAIFALVKLQELLELDKYRQNEIPAEGVRSLYTYLYAMDTDAAVQPARRSSYRGAGGQLPRRNALPPSSDSSRAGSQSRLRGGVCAYPRGLLRSPPASAYDDADIDGRTRITTEDLVRVGPFLVCRHLAQDPRVLHREAQRLVETALGQKYSLSTL